MRSDIIKKGFERAPHRSLLKATGVTDADMNKPFIAVCNSFTEIIPGHVHLNKVSEIVKQAVREAGGQIRAQIRANTGTHHLFPNTKYGDTSLI